MIKVLVAGLIGTVAGVVAMIVVIVLAGTTTSGASSVGLGALPLSTASLTGGATSTPTSTPPPTSGGGTSTGGATGNADNGKTLFTGSAGCGGCHALAAAGTSGAVGPALDNLSGDAQKAGEPLDAFIKSSIVDPGAYVPSGYQDGVMPTNFGTRLTAAQLETLVDYLASRR